MICTESEKFVNRKIHEWNSRITIIDTCLTDYGERIDSISDMRGKECCPCCSFKFTKKEKRILRRRFQYCQKQYEFLVKKKQKATEFKQKWIQTMSKLISKRLARFETRTVDEIDTDWDDYWEKEHEKRSNRRKRNEKN